MALRAFPVDSLPAEIRHKAIDRVKRAMLAAEEIGAAIDALLREHAKSDLIDPDPADADRAAQRSKQMKEIQAMYPGRWRAPRGRRGKRK